MEKYKKASLYSLITCLIFSINVTVMEYPMIQHHREFYLGGKIFIHLWQIVLCFLVQRDAYKVSTNLQVGTMLMAYCIHGQYFSPWYIFAYHQLLMAFSFLFPLPKKIFNIFALTAASAYILMMWYRFENIQTWVNENSRVEWLYAVIAITIVALLSHSFFTADRNYREALIRKFGLVGFQTASVVHDVKGMLASPLMNIEMLKTYLTGAEPTEVQELVNAVESQLTKISQSVRGLNQVVALHKEKKEQFKFSELLTEVSGALSVESRGIRLEVKGDADIFSEKGLLKSVLFNILMNSVQAFRNSHSEQPYILIECQKDCLTISDNGGGYKDEILRAVSGEDFSQENGLGMGLFLISTGAQSLGGKVHFANSGNGAKVQLNFPFRGLR